MATAAAAPALIERVEPNCSMCSTTSQEARMFGREPGTLLPEDEDALTGQVMGLQGNRARKVVDADQRYAAAVGTRGGRPPDEVGRVRVVVLVLVAVRHHRAPPVPAPPAHDVEGRGVEGVGGADHRPDVEVVPPVLDRDVEAVPAGVEVGDDGVEPPVPVALDDIAPVAVAQQVRVEVVARGPGARPRPHSHLLGACALAHVFAHFPAHLLAHVRHPTDRRSRRVPVALPASRVPADSPHRIPLGRDALPRPQLDGPPVAP